MPTTFKEYIVDNRVINAEPKLSRPNLNNKKFVTPLVKELLKKLAILIENEANFSMNKLLQQY